MVFGQKTGLELEDQIGRDLIFPIPRINNTENNTIQEYSILTKNFLKTFYFIAFLAISDNFKHFLKITLLEFLAINA